MEEDVAVRKDGSESKDIEDDKDWEQVNVSPSEGDMK